jgi:hypothetical protein
MLLIIGKSPKEVIDTYCKHHFIPTAMVNPITNCLLRFIPGSIIQPLQFYRLGNAMPSRKDKVEKTKGDDGEIDDRFSSRGCA